MIEISHEDIGDLNEIMVEKEILPTKWFKTEQISTWIGEPLGQIPGKPIEEMDGGHGKLIIMHQCGNNKEELKSQINTFLAGLEEGFEYFAC